MVSLMVTYNQQGDLDMVIHYHPTRFSYVQKSFHHYSDKRKEMVGFIVSQQADIALIKVPHLLKIRA